MDVRSLLKAKNPITSRTGNERPNIENPRPDGVAEHFCLMARGATIFRAELEIADMDRSYYASHSLTLALHPSETEERMMIRLLAFALFAGDDLAFGGGVSTQDEADLWEKDLTGSITLWIEIGHPEERTVRKACGKSRQTVVVCYGGRASTVWWKENLESFQKLKNLTIIQIPQTASQALAKLADRNMKLNINIQDGIVSVIKGDDTVEVELEFLTTAR